MELMHSSENIESIYIRTREPVQWHIKFGKKVIHNLKQFCGEFNNKIKVITIDVHTRDGYLCCIFTK